MYGHMGWPGRKAPETLMSRDVPASWRVSSCSHRAQALAMPPRWYLGRNVREEDDLVLGLLGIKPLALRGKMQTELMSCLPWPALTTWKGFGLPRRGGRGEPDGPGSTSPTNLRTSLMSWCPMRTCSTMRGTGVSMNRTTRTGHQAWTKTTVHCSPQATLSSMSAHTKCSSHNYNYLGLDVIGSLIYLVILILI